MALQGRTAPPVCRSSAQESLSRQEGLAQQFRPSTLGVTIRQHPLTSTPLVVPQRLGRGFSHDGWSGVRAKGCVRTGPKHEHSSCVGAQGCAGHARRAWGGGSTCMGVMLKPAWNCMGPMEIHSDSGQLCPKGTSTTAPWESAGGLGLGMCWGFDQQVVLAQQPDRWCARVVCIWSHSRWRRPEPHWPLQVLGRGWCDVSVLHEPKGADHLGAEPW